MSRPTTGVPLTPEPDIEALCDKAHQLLLSLVATDDGQHVAVAATLEQIHELQNTYQSALVALLQGRLSVNPISAGVLIEYGLRTLHDIQPDLTMPQVLNGLSKVVSSIFGPAGLQDLMSEIKRFASSQPDEEARQIGFMPATKTKKEIIH